MHCMDRPYSYKLLTVNNYVNCPSNFAFACSIYLFHLLIFEKILMRIRSIKSQPIALAMQYRELECKYIHVRRLSEIGQVCLPSYPACNHGKHGVKEVCV